MKKFNYDDYISHSYFKYKVENVDKNIHIDWSIKNDSNNISNGFLLREKNGCNYIMCDLNLQNNLPILNLVFRPSNIEITPEDTLSFYLKDNILIELHASKQTEFFKNKKCNTYYLSGEVLDLLKEMPIQRIVINSHKIGSIDLKSRVIGRRAFNIYIEIYNRILEVNTKLINTIPEKLECSVAK